MGAKPNNRLQLQPW